MLIRHTIDDLENVYFTADQHFAHENIIKFCNRPFENVAAMDDTLVENWNKVIPHNALVYHLGDFTLSDANIADQFFIALNGKIRILGNPWHHDRRWLAYDYQRDPFRTYDEHEVEILPPMVVIEVPWWGEKKHPLAIHLSHYPLAEWDRKHHGAWHLHGHSHGNYKGDARHTGEYCIDVGVDVWNYHPLSFGGLLEVMYGLGWM